MFIGYFKFYCNISIEIGVIMIDKEKIFTESQLSDLSRLYELIFVPFGEALANKIDKELKDWDHLFLKQREKEIS